MIHAVNYINNYKYCHFLFHTSGYHGFILYFALGHVGGGNSCGGYTPMGVATTHAA